MAAAPQRSSPWRSYVYSKGFQAETNLGTGLEVILMRWGWHRSSVVEGFEKKFQQQTRLKERKT